MKKILGLTKQAGNEPPEFVAEHRKFLQSLETLRKLEAQLTAWVKITRTLKKLSLDIGETIGTDEMPQIVAQLDKKDDSKAALGAVKSKIILLSEVAAQHKLCKKEWKEHGKLNKKLSTMTEKSKKKEDEQLLASIETLTQKTRDTKERADGMYSELYASMKFINTQSTILTEEGKEPEICPANLVRHELNAFRVSQFDYLMKCSKLMSGRKEICTVDYDSQIKAFLENSRDRTYHERVDAVRKAENIDDLAPNFAKLDLQMDSMMYEDEDEASTKGIRSTGLENLRPRVRSKSNDSEGLLPDYTRYEYTIGWDEIESLRSSTNTHRQTSSKAADVGG